MSDTKILSFAERFIALREAFKIDTATLTDQAKQAEVDMPALRRLVSWMSKDATERAEQEAVDDQYRFLAGLLPSPAELPAESQLATAAALYADKLTIRAVAKEMGISVGKAHALKIKAAAFNVQPRVNMNTQETNDGQAREVAGNPDGPRGVAEGATGSADAAELLDSDGTQRGEAGPPCNAGPGAERRQPDGRSAPEDTPAIRVTGREAAVAGSGPGAQPGTTESKDLEFNRRSGFSRDIPATVFATGLAHEGEDDGHLRNERGAAGRGRDSGDADGRAVGHAGRQSGAPAGHAGPDRGPAGALLAAADADADEGRVAEPAAGAAARHVGLAALHGADDLGRSRPAGEHLQAHPRADVMENATVPTNEIGAVASHSDGERVATTESNPIPPFLVRVVAPAQKPSHPYEPVITGSVSGGSA